MVLLCNFADIGSLTKAQKCHLPGTKVLLSAAALRSVPIQLIQICQEVDLLDLSDKVGDDFDPLERKQLIVTVTVPTAIF